MAYILIQPSLQCCHHCLHVPFRGVCKILVNTMQYECKAHSLNAIISCSWFASSWRNRSSNRRWSASLASSFRDCQSWLPSRADIYSSYPWLVGWMQKISLADLKWCNRSVKPTMIAFDHCNPSVLGKQCLQKTLLILCLDECSDFTEQSSQYNRSKLNYHSA